MALDRSNEYCVDCGDPTGRAGNFEDSLFLDEEGPLCDDCYRIKKEAKDKEEEERLFGKEVT